MKGLLIFAGTIVFVALFCGVLPLVVMPGAGIGVALPVISVPGEILEKNFPFDGFNLTNTLIGTLLADIGVLVFAFGATRNMKEVPGRLQGLFETLSDALYGVTKATAGPNAKKIFPLMATVFLFLLVANWLELVPGVDSVGLMHCAEDGFNGYEKNGLILEVSEALDPGTKATEADYEACHNKDHADEEHAEDAEDAAHEGEETAAVAATEGESGGDESATGESEHAAGEEAARDDLYVVTPFVRAAATDLNLTLALGLIAFLSIQYFGVRSLGMRYFAKFVNTPALGNLDKRPMGVMDFVVGLLEIISEIAKILSFGFRLFGNIFAGQVLLFVMAFLVALVLPAVFYGLELFVGLIQAFVFAMLLLVFSSMAMEKHGHDDDH
ncbi:MAG: F0F1 ATP synthase subunit A [Anaerolineae bacterium]|nr:F0F1 ATP synthase subunit A [Anaerolineae bacterium]